jgi:hypothetical protein
MPPLPEPDDTWSVSDVYLLTDGSQGRVAIPHLALRFAEDGIELAKDDGELAWHCAWSALDVLSTVGQSVLPDGREGVVLVIIEHGGRQHRFVLPATDPETVQSQVRARARQHRIQTFEPPAAVSRTLTVAVVVAAIATLTVLLLSAAHVLHL